MNLLQKLNLKNRGIISAVSHLAEEGGLSVYLAGGAVRDVLLGLSTFDLDVVVVPSEAGDWAAGLGFARELARANRMTIKEFADFGTASLACGDIRLDITTARTEKYPCSASLPVVGPGNLREDAARRDFTINSISFGLTKPDKGKLVDYYSGQPDLKAGLIRVLHQQSFIDDPTRIFRAIRYEQRLGFKIEKKTEEYSKRDLYCIRYLTGPRIRNELNKIFSEGKSFLILTRLQELKFLGQIHPELILTSGAKKYFKTRKKSNEAADWSWLLDNFDLKEKRQVIARLQLPKLVSKKIISKV